MSTKNNPGAFRCYEAALPDEHVFTILARDPAGPATLRFWATEREKLGKTQNPDDLDRIDDARRDALLMEDWREKNLDPMGDGGLPAWKMTQINDEQGGPIRTAKDPTVYVPAERDGDEAVRINVEWLTARTRDLVEGRMSREEYTQLIELACQSPDRRNAVGSPSAPTAGLSGTEEADDNLIYRLEGAIHSLRDGRLPTPYDLYRAVKKDGDGTGWNYECIGLGLPDLEAALNRLQRDAPVAEKKPYSDQFHEEMQKPETPLYGRNETKGERVVIDTHPDDLAHAPEVPPHRFSVFRKGERYAYARGLEIAPAHLPTALDAMAADGWFLIAIFGQTDSQHVGFIFERREREWSTLELVHGFGGPSREELERRREGPQYARFMGGEALDDIRKDDPPVGESEIGGACGMGRGQEP